MHKTKKLLHALLECAEYFDLFDIHCICCIVNKALVAVIMLGSGHL